MSSPFSSLTAALGLSLLSLCTVTASADVVASFQHRQLSVSALLFDNGDTPDNDAFHENKQAPDFEQYNAFVFQTGEIEEATVSLYANHRSAILSDAITGTAELIANAVTSSDGAADLFIENQVNVVFELTESQTADFSADLTSFGAEVRTSLSNLSTGQTVFFDEAVDGGYTTAEFVGVLEPGEYQFIIRATVLDNVDADETVSPSGAFDFELNFGAVVSVPDAASAGLSVLRAWPNPALSFVHIESPSGPGDVFGAVDVFDVSGRRIKSLQYDGAPQTWDLKNDGGETVAPGVYLLRPRGSESVTRIVVGQ